MLMILLTFRRVKVGHRCFCTPRGATFKANQTRSFCNCSTSRSLVANSNVQGAKRGLNHGHTMTHTVYCCRRFPLSILGYPILQIRQRLGIGFTCGQDALNPISGAHNAHGSTLPYEGVKLISPPCLSHCRYDRIKQQGALKTNLAGDAFYSPPL